MRVLESDISQILEDVSKEDLFKECHEGPMKSDQTRKTFFKKSFSYVEPTQLYLGADAAGRERFFQYVPIKQTLRSLLNQSVVKDQYRQTKMKQMSQFQLDVLADVKDGKTIKDNTLLKESPSSLSIILYQDSFEVVNPLGSGKKKHKILAVYLTLGEILPHNRSCIDPMQLVLLCREEDFRFFGQEKILSPLVADLKDIEELGFETKDGSSLKGTLIAISGDNLGSHSIGGFTENFSKSKNFCRYCMIDRDTFQRHPGKLAPKRTLENYRECVEQLKGGQYIVNGIKFDSIFNNLTHFHVCSPGVFILYNYSANLKKKHLWLRMIRIIVDAIRAHCPNPTKAECSQIAKNVVAQYPKSFGDVTDEGDLLGSGYTSLLNQIKTRYLSTTLESRVFQDRSYYHYWRRNQHRQRVQYILDRTGQCPPASCVRRALDRENTWTTNRPSVESVLLAWAPCQELSPVADDPLLISAVVLQNWKGLSIKNYEGKGKGVITTMKFKMNQVVCDYHGAGETCRGAVILAEPLCIDAQNFPCICHPEQDTYGRRMNHSRKVNNVRPLRVKMHFPDGQRECVLFLALRDIGVGEELLWDYGVRRSSFHGEGRDVAWLDD
ncbi:hypothetical protein IRJ41_003851 [Triplophysa rosa]|uniref:SET domain-containing protein n=1 Tax=Triplophysa rosa TaxID=992332 RepID=A0A9W7TSD0_TRIRA|nr:hypothetical protein IRJ41_003851 [Triplophysa rosa]